MKITMEVFQYEIMEDTLGFKYKDLNIISDLFTSSGGYICHNI
jgi:hypothetical protein